MRRAVVPLAGDTPAPAGCLSAETFAKLGRALSPSRDLPAGDRLANDRTLSAREDSRPVVFVHPLVWTTMVNELQAQPALIDRYQLGTFRYDTMVPSSYSSAASPRRQLVELQTMTPQR